MTKKPEILEKSTIAQSRIFNIEQLHLRFSNGAERHFERLVSRSNGAVVAIPLLKEGTLLLVREYAAGVDRYELGFPRGIVEKNEDPVQAANREMMEEIGYGARDLRVITKMTTSPGYWGNVATIVLAQDLYEAHLPGDEPEPLEVIPWRIQDYRDLLKRKDFTEARSIAALLLVKEMLL